MQFVEQPLEWLDARWAVHAEEILFLWQASATD